ncbi:3-isopropylmalate dehydrogenase [Patulibacter medicamentivorans]|uniref:3-isopropylmalate dehydrogenase n=1 Tax=Patulibacter medicamentivorans TaxID=1097667 RepID=H0E725_9ACTN|nr:isocitrate/isopropylmalate dehydrogenase family protein [Patulibacter medicamentivorans]EHN10520.1 3-isopropylmalate dehydrogenase [Patulibacter medicamentivorans]
MSAPGQTLRIAVVRGDGVGPEVVDASLPAIVAAAAVDGVAVVLTELDWGGDRQIRTGRAMPDDALDVVRRHDAILFGAIGHPDLDPAESVWSLVLPLRKGLELYANLRPVVGWEGLSTPARDGAKVDFLVVRENTEGEYSGIGGRTHRGTPLEVATEVAIHSRPAIERIARCGFGHARERGQTLTLATKSNVNRHGYGLWDEVVFAIGEREFPDVALEKMYVDALATRMVARPESLGVVLCGNLFGDILSDLGAPFAGGLGMAPSANVAPDLDVPGFFEPVHGSAPDIAGRGIANPLATVLSGAMLLRENGCPRGADALERAVAATVAEGSARTRDLGGVATTGEAGAAVLAALGDAVPA